MSAFQPIGGLSPLPPEIVAWGPNNETLFAFAVGTDHALWFTRFDGFFKVGEHWSSWQSLGGIAMSPPSAVRSGTSSVDVFAAGPHSDLLHWQFRNGTWTEWPAESTTGGAVPLAPHIFPPGPHRYWESMGGIITSPPSATLFGGLSDEIGVFASGTDHALWVKSCVGGSWQGWNSLGSHVVSSPPRAVTFQGDFVVFALGTDSAVWYTTGGNWRSLGGQFSRPPYAVTTSAHTYVFAPGVDGALRYAAWDGNTWSGWELLGGLLMSQPTASSFPNSELLHVYAVGADSIDLRRNSRLDLCSDPNN